MKKEEKSPNILKLVKTEKPEARKKKPSNNVYITDERFKRALDLINEDMNRALGSGQQANISFQLLLGYLVEAGIVDREKFNLFIERNLKESQS
ncbi:MAG: hypothetical protein ACE5GM_11010 [bacterium]